MFFGKLADEGDKSNIYNVEGDNLVDNSNIYNVEGDNLVDNSNIYNVEGDNLVDNSNIYNVEGDNLVDNSNIYNVEGNNRLLPGLQLMITRSVLKIPFFPFFSVFVFSIQEIILLSSAKQNIQILDILE